MKTIVTALVALGALAGAAGAETLLERGEYLVQGPMGCGNCHTPIGPEGFDFDADLGGRLVVDAPVFTAFAPNITPGGVVADWSDAELARAIREGIRPDGSLIGPPMPFTVYRGLSDDDLAAVVAYLRRVPAVESTLPASEYRISLPPAYGPPVESVTAPEPGVTLAYGQYMATAVAHCLECHTPMGPQGFLYDTDLGRGGMEYPGPWGVSVASNLTSHEDGLAGYTDAEIAVMTTQGVRPDGSAMKPPMPYGYFAKMTEDDLAAVILYLRSLPPLTDLK